MERRSKRTHDPSSKGKSIHIEEPQPHEESQEEEEARPTTLLFKFLSPQNKSRFEFLEKKTIKTGAEIRIQEIGQFHLLNLFQRQRWDPILNIEGQTYKTITYMFYANIEVHNDDDTKFNTMVQGKTITISPKIIGKVLGIPNKGVDIYGHSLSTFEHYPDGEDKFSASKILHGSTRLFGDTKAATLVPRARVLSSILGFTIIPKSGGRDRVTATHKLLTYCMLAGIKVNLPLLILRYMVYISTSIGSLYYGNIITKILKFFGIDPTVDYAIVSQDKYFGNYNIKLMNLIDKPLSEEEESSEEEAQPHPPTPPPSSHTTTTEPPLPSAFDSFQQQVFQRLDTIEHKIDYDMAYTQYHINYFYENSGYPPPPAFQFPPYQPSSHIPTPPPSPSHSHHDDDDA